MNYRRFGRTGLDMSVLTCGGMRFQHKWQAIKLEEVPPDGQANLERIVGHAINLGINHFETARGYGSSELQLGLILPNLDRNKLIVQTKVGPTEDPAEFRKSCDESLELLGLDYLDLLSIHGINTAERLEQTLGPGGCLEAARQLQAEGRVRFIGFSTHAPLDLLLSAIESDEFDYVNLHW